MLMKRTKAKETVFFITLLAATSVAGADVVDAGAPPVSFDVAGETLEFTHSSDVNVGDLPFTYADILPSLDDGCLQGRISRLFRENIDVNDVDESGSVEIEFDMEAVPNDVEPVGLEGLTEWQLDFLFDADCDPNTENAVEAEVRNMCLHMEDIDLYQFFGVSGADSYVRSASSVLDFVHRSGFMTAVDTTNTNANFSNQDHWAQFDFESVTSFRFQLGIGVGSSDDDAAFHLAFSCPEWTVRTVEQGTSIEFDSPTLEHYISRAQEMAEETLPNTE